MGDWDWVKTAIVALILLGPAVRWIFQLIVPKQRQTPPQRAGQGQ